MNMNKLSEELNELVNRIHYDSKKLFTNKETTPSSEFIDLEFLKFTNESFSASLESLTSSTFQLGNQLFYYLNNLTSPSNVIKEKKVFETSEDLFEDYEKVVDLLDSVFESIDTILDRLNTKNSKGTTSLPFQSIPVLSNVFDVVNDKQLDIKLIHAQNVMRPQLKFKDKIDNFSSVFISKIKDKPNALVPLPHEYLSPSSNSRIEKHTHPYAFEIENLDYPKHMFTVSDPIKYLTLEETAYEFINTELNLINLEKYLCTVSEMSIDLENHSYRSYQGFCCLIQISTRKRDFLIDALELRHILYILNSSFTNPSIIKVLHGSESDVLWLQRDFGLYLVNVFDTFVASKSLDYPNNSLAYLLKHYIGLVIDKKYQLADWRIRPLPIEMVKYAREDTHYLLNIFDLMRNDILTKPNIDNQRLMRNVLKKSAELCLNVYEKEIYNERESWKATFFKYSKPFTKHQMNVFKALHIWRDHLAREEDESTRFVLPNHMLLQIAETIPIDTPILLGCCNPVPPLVRQHAVDLVLLIQRIKCVEEDPLSALNVSSTPILQNNPMDTKNIEHENTIQSELSNPSRVITTQEAPKSTLMSAFESISPYKSKATAIIDAIRSSSFTTYPPMIVDKKEEHDSVDHQNEAILEAEAEEKKTIEDDSQNETIIHDDDEDEDENEKIDFGSFLKPGQLANAPHTVSSRTLAKIPQVMPYEYSKTKGSSHPMDRDKKDFKSDSINKKRKYFNPSGDIEEPKEFKSKLKKGSLTATNKSMTFKNI